MYKKILNTIRHRNLLHGAMIELTYGCNLDCRFCYNAKNAKGTPLHIDQYLSLLQDLRQLQVLFLSFTGGEPLLHPFFFEIAGAARQLGFVVRVKSNGLLIHGEIAKRLKEEVNPLEVELSLHGAVAATHDRQTRSAGSFSRLIAHVAEMKQLDLRPSFVSTLTSWNEKETEAMFALADSLGIDLRFQGPVGPKGLMDGGDWQNITLQPSSEGWQELARVVASRKTCSDAAPSLSTCGSDEPPVQSAKVWCGTGSQEVLVDPFGTVFPCLHLRWPAGNLHQQSFAGIWQQGNGRVFIKARKLSRDVARTMDAGVVTQLGAPLFCPGIDQQIS